uniref:Uncharacterized protein n=1 Tax=Arion vulgaris TaxID=1028688 RepID=A0A0B6ZQZ5_9EUPU
MFYHFNTLKMNVLQKHCLPEPPLAALHEDTYVSSLYQHPFLLGPLPTPANSVCIHSCRDLSLYMQTLDPSS